MADVVLFHSALGVQPVTHAAAERMRAVGHTVHVPDLFEGATFATPDRDPACAELLWRRMLAFLTRIGWGRDRRTTS